MPLLTAKTTLVYFISSCFIGPIIQLSVTFCKYRSLLKKLKFAMCGYTLLIQVRVSQTHLVKAQPREWKDEDTHNMEDGQKR